MATDLWSAWSGPPGIGKTRLVREAVAIAAGRGVEVFSTFCESHASDVPFQVVARLLRAAPASSGLDEQPRETRVRDRFPTPTLRTCCCSMTCWASPIPTCRCPTIDPDARRRRMTALINAASLARTRPRSTSSRTRTGSTRSASRCWPTFSR